MDAGEATGYAYEEITDTGAVMRERRAGYSTQGHDFDDATGLFESDPQRFRCGSANQGCGLSQFVKRAAGDQPALVDDDDIVGELFDLVEEMAGDEHRVAFGRSEERRLNSTYPAAFRSRALISAMWRPV